MREILFRGKRIDNGEWVEGGYNHEKVGEYFTAVFIIEHLTSGVWENHRVDPATVGQYTGLTDKNGKKIFEGDIVRDLCLYESHLKYVELGDETIEQAEKYRYCGDVAVVEFCTEDVGSCGCCYPKFSGTGFKAGNVMLYSCEVIGNIHDNPEFLEVN